MFIVLIYEILQGVRWKAMMMKTGPNDALGVVWFIGLCLFFFPNFFFFDTN